VWIVGALLYLLVVPILLARLRRARAAAVATS